jgi:hypothetical protein
MNNIKFANELAAIHNAQSANVTLHNPNYVSALEFTGNTRELAPIRELVPNQKNPALMDSCTITRTEGEFILKYRSFSGKRIRTSRVWYYIGQTIVRDEIGSHYSA